MRSSWFASEGGRKAELNHPSLNMKVCHTLFCFFFLTLQDGNIGLINAEIPIYTGTEGQSITVPCHFTNIGRRKYFCKDECDDNHLVATSDVRAQSGRYSMEYENTRAGSRLYVTIRQLTKSDSGRYGCGLDISFSRDPYREFEIIVTDAPSTTKPNLTLRPSLTSVQSASTPSSSSAETTDQSEEQQTEKRTAGGSAGVLLYVGLTLVIIVLLLSVAVLIFCKKRATKPKEHPVETEYANVTRANRVYEEIGEDGRQSRSPPVEISSIYTVTFTKPSDAATASCPLNKTEDDSSELIYTQVDFSNSAAASLGSAPHGHADNVVYSAPRKRTEARTDAKDVSQPLY